MDVRRVVTGHDASGRSVFVSDDTVAPDVPLLMPDAEYHQLWGGDATPSFPDDGAKVTLHPGDTVVQNGTRRRWHNPGDTTARVAVFMCGAAHSGIAPRR